ncbi:MAG: hypothetical protein ACRD4Y_17055, partial [Candidatus Acidiferrales bacterium]
MEPRLRRKRGESLLGQRGNRLLRILLLLPAIVTALASNTRAQTALSNPFLVEEHAVSRVSDHVYVIPSK